MVIRTTLPTTERLFWHCGNPTAKPESASRARSIPCFQQHLLLSVARGLGPSAALHAQQGGDTCGGHERARQCTFSDQLQVLRPHELPIRRPLCLEDDLES